MESLFDCSGECKPNAKDCFGNCGGIAKLDECDVCIAGGENDSDWNVTCLDCAGNPNGMSYEDNCGTCDDTDWNDCEAITVDLHDNANLTSFYVLPEDSSLDNILNPL